MQEQQRSSVGEHGVDVDIFDVGQVGNTVVGQVQVTQLRNRAEFTGNLKKNCQNSHR